MKLEDMKAIAKKRTKGEWSHSFAHVKIDHQLGSSSMACMPCDAPFIAMAANNFDALIKVAKAAKKMQSTTHWGMAPLELRFSTELDKALKELEKEI